MSFKVFAKVYVTSNFLVFKKFKGNRDVRDERHVTQIMDAIRDGKYIPPILVTKDTKVVNGQHTLEAHRRMGVAVQFIIVTKKVTLSDIQDMNINQKQWFTIDFIKSNADCGMVGYRKLYEFIQETKINPDHARFVLGLDNSSHSSKSLKKGAFNKKLLTVDYATARLCVECFKEVRAVYGGNSIRNLLRGYLFLFRHPNYNHSHFIGKLQMQKSKCVPCARPVDYQQNL